jgi:hypothetical protein
VHYTAQQTAAPVDHVVLDAHFFERLPVQPMTCAHCGRTDTIMGSMSTASGRVQLCHANKDGTKSDPDCYHLVTVWGEKLGSRLEKS